MTFLLVAVVYAVAIGKPNFSETGPLAVGFALWCSAFVGRSPIPPEMFKPRNHYCVHGQDTEYSYS